MTKFQVVWNDFYSYLLKQYKYYDLFIIIRIFFAVKIKGQKNIKEYGSENFVISNPSKLPNSQIIEEMQEPLVLGTIIVPSKVLDILPDWENLSIDTDDLLIERIFFSYLRRRIFKRCDRVVCR